MEKSKIQEVAVEAKGKGTEKTLMHHVVGAMGVGLIPIPVVDLVALTGIQLNMLRKLAKAYDIPFSKDKGKNIIGSLIGGGLPLPLATTFYSLVKSVPILGQTTGVLAMPLLAGATTYAVGKVFNQHFATGGNFINFDPDKVRDYYEEMFKEGQKVAAELKDEEPTEEKAA